MVEAEGYRAYHERINRGPTDKYQREYRRLISVRHSSGCELISTFRILKSEERKADWQCFITMTKKRRALSRQRSATADHPFPKCLRLKSLFRPTTVHSEDGLNLTTQPFPTLKIGLRLSTFPSYTHHKRAAIAQAMPTDGIDALP